MSRSKRSKANPFYINNRRAMVSLGPLSNALHCPYRCAFCYVQDEFCSYANMDVDEIIIFLNNNRDKYDIIYVSGDTDSFAPPRTAQGLDLLYKIVMEIDCDLLFTTRTIFSENNYKTLQMIVDEQNKTGNKLYACVSITRFSDIYSYLEPHPIPTPEERIEVLRRLKHMGAITVLATRPFLPMVPIEDYLKIIEKTKDFVDMVLGECFYFVRGGAIQKRVFPDGISPDVEKKLKKQKMTFDDNQADWDVWDSTEYQEAVRKKCIEYEIVFAMHSADAIELFLQLG